MFIMPKKASIWSFNPYLTWRALRLSESYQGAIRDFESELSKSGDKSVRELYDSLTSKGSGFFKHPLCSGNSKGSILTTNALWQDPPNLRFGKFKPLLSKQGNRYTGLEREERAAISVRNKRFALPRAEVTSSQFPRPFYVESLSSAKKHYKEHFRSIADSGISSPLVKFLSRYGDVLGFPIPAQIKDPDPIFLAIVWNLRPVRTCPLLGYDEYLSFYLMALHESQFPNRSRLSCVFPAVFNTNFSKARVVEQVKDTIDALKSDRIHYSDGNGRAFSLNDPFKLKTANSVTGIHWDDPEGTICRIAFYEEIIKQSKSSGQSEKSTLIKMINGISKRSSLVPASHNTTYRTRERWCRSAYKAVLGLMKRLESPSLDANAKTKRVSLPERIIKKATDRNSLRELEARLKKLRNGKNN